MGGIPGKRFRNGSGETGAGGDELGRIGLVAAEGAGEAAGVGGLAAAGDPGDASVQPQTPSKLTIARRRAAAGTPTAGDSSEPSSPHDPPSRDHWPQATSTTPEPNHARPLWITAPASTLVPSWTRSRPPPEGTL